MQVKRVCASSKWSWNQNQPGGVHPGGDPRPAWGEIRSLSTLESSLCCHPLFVAVSVFGLDSLKLTYFLRGHEKLWKTTDLALVSQAFDCKKFAHRQTVYQSSVIPFTFYQLLQKRVPCIIFHTAPSVSTSLFSSKVAFCAVHFSLTNV